MKKGEFPSLARSPSGDQQVVLASGLPALPERLLLAHAEGRVLFVAGAGVSMQAPARLPDFGRLVRRVFAQLDKAIAVHLEAQAGDWRGGRHTISLPRLDAEQAAMLRRVEDREYDVALGILERRMDRDQEKESSVRRAVADILRESEQHAPIHASLVRLADRGGATTIATTNFDLLLERAGRALATPLRRYALQDIPRPSLRPEFGGVLHLHGALDPDPGRHADLVLTDRDFGEHYMRRRAIPDLVYDAARIFNVVLVGYSLGDPPMRYLLNAVAADGQRFSDLKERFAFVGMGPPADRAARERQAAELATWRGRGITPISYDSSAGHKALADVLAAWAALSPHGGRRGVADDELRRILRLRRAAASEDTVALFGHLFRRGGDEAQARIAATSGRVRADPAWLDGMLEIVRERGRSADREAHASRLCQVAIGGRFSDPEMLRWAARLPAEAATERSAVRDAVRWRLDAATPEPWRTAWRTVAEAHLAPVTVARREHDFDLGRRLNEGDRSGGLIAEVAALVAPRLSVEWRDDVAWLDGKPPRRPRGLDDILHLSMTSGRVEIGRALALDGVREVPFLVELADALEAEVARGLHLARRIGWREGRSVVWLGGLDRVRLRGDGDRDEPDRFNRGIAQAVRLLLHVVGRLAALDPEAVKPALRRWLTRSDPVHVRMWAAAALEPSLADAAEVGRFLLRRPPEEKWDADRFPELAELRAVRFADLCDADRSAIARELMRGPPAAILGRRGSGDGGRRSRIGWAVRELVRIEAAGTALPAPALRWLQERRSEFADFASDEPDEDYRSGAFEVGSPPTTGTDLDGLDGEALAGAVDGLLRSATDPWRGPARAVWDWLDDEGRTERLVRSLLSAGCHLERFGRAWDAVGRRHRPPERDTADQKSVPPESLSASKEVVHALLGMSDPVLKEATPGLSAWLDRWASHLRGDGAFPSAIARLWPFAAAASSRTTDSTQDEDEEEEEGTEARRVAQDSLSSPIGELAGAFLSACPNLSEVPNPFEDDDGLRAVRDLVAGTEGRAGLVARYRCVTELPFLMRADRAWAEAVLLARLEAGPESDVLWHALAHSPHRRNVMARLGRLMAHRAAGDGLGQEVRRSLVDRVCIAIISDLWIGQADADLLPDAQQMLRSVPDELRAHAALAVERFVDNLTQTRSGTPPACEAIFDRAVEPFLRDVWPQERTAVTPAVAEAFASLPATSGRRFARAVAAVRRFLVPFEAWSIGHWGLLDDDHRSIRQGVIVGAEEAKAALDLLDLTIGKGVEVRAPTGLDAALAHVASQNAPLARDPRFARLSTLARP